METAGLVAPKTSPTLVGFQPKSPTLPDWRLQLQNAVQQRKGSYGTAATPAAAPSLSSSVPVAVRTEMPTAEPAAAGNISDPRVANAMKRIAESRNAFSTPAQVVKKASPKPTQMRSFPFDVVAPSGTAMAAAPARASMPVTPAPKPRLVIPEPAVVEKRDTNKLPPLPEPGEKFEKIDTTPEVMETVAERIVSGSLPAEFGEIKRIRIRAEHVEIEAQEETDSYDEEIDDLAPFSMRFGAGLFDFIIGSFVSALFLAPFALTGANWLTASGVLTFLAATAIISFLYMTISIGFFGKTMGMRLFSLEIVDAMENEYPTLHQAAISSSLYLLTLAFAGAGFVTALFNEERRAIHDLLSGTIVVREF